ncbi:cupin domain-containing protein [Enterobacillus tribolii]|uniref:Cupin 2 conserved barrel domain-containing protein n=1 Tax=Enterobacillus tribolii TaxID=1487935 RepID=A0A370R3K1_9GAMM|nr:cupin domain-containing protein [Enterobacillus tribolii]RDK97016.1 hypothetical protein C8D90_101456 [Enterobacillus tribolii]
MVISNSAVLPGKLHCLIPLSPDKARVPFRQINQSIAVTSLLRTTTSWDGTRYAGYPAGQPEITVLKITLSPHSLLPWHIHPVPSAVYILDGELTVENHINGEKITLRKGSVMPDMVNRIHRGFTRDQHASLIVFYAGSPGMILTQPVSCR